MNARPFVMEILRLRAGSPSTLPLLEILSQQFFQEPVSLL